MLNGEFNTYISSPKQLLQFSGTCMDVVVVHVAELLLGCTCAGCPIIKITDIEVVIDIVT